MLMADTMDVKRLPVAVEMAAVMVVVKMSPKTVVNVTATIVIPLLLLPGTAFHIEKALFDRSPSLQYLIYCIPLADHFQSRIVSNDPWPAYLC